ncbi:ovomucoid-like [Cochliomyia hominivorax]
MKFLNVILVVLLAIFAFSVQNIDAICPCPRNYDPVCGSNSVTYPNRCEFDCSRREVERSGRSLSLLRSGPC